MKKNMLRTVTLTALSLALALLMAFSVFANVSGMFLTASAQDTVYWDGTATAPTAGLGTVDDPYQITKGSELAYVVGLSAEETTGKYYAITKDIYMNQLQDSYYDANGYIAKYSGLNWPSGALTGDWSFTKFGAFAGTLDGQGHKVVGLLMDWASSGYWGLFGTLAQGATVKNVHIDSAYYMRDSVTNWSRDNSYAAGIAGQVTGDNVTIEGCTVYKSTFNDRLTGWANAGGIIGISYDNNNIAIKNCGVDANFLNFKADYVAGGILGDNWAGAEGDVKVSNCWSNIFPADNSNTVGSRVTYTDCYSLAAPSAETGVTSVPGVTVVTGAVKSAAAATTMPNLGWNTKWSTVDNANPMPIIQVAPVEPTGFSIDETKEIDEGKDATIAPAFTPAAASDTIVWSSSDDSVATVDANGKVTAVKRGTATITATLENYPELSDTCEVTVYGVVDSFTVVFSGDLPKVVFDVFPSVSVSSEGVVLDTAKWNDGIDEVLGSSLAQFGKTYGVDVAVILGPQYHFADTVTYNVTGAAGVTGGTAVVGGNVATATITGTTVVAKDISNTTVRGVESIMFDSEATEFVQDAIEVIDTDISEALDEGTDYDVTYENNTAVGTATVVITGKGNYTGTIRKDFAIYDTLVQDPAADNKIPSEAGGKAVEFDASVLAVGGEGAYSYALEGAPSWLSIDAATGKITGTRPNENAEASTFKVIITDAAGNTLPVEINLGVITKVEEEDNNNNGGTTTGGTTADGTTTGGATTGTVTGTPAPAPEAETPAGTTSPKTDDAPNALYILFVAALGGAVLLLGKKVFGR